jgi:hypothetical protein
MRTLHTLGYLKNARLTSAFERKEQGVRERSQVLEPLVQLSTLRRDNYDEWVTYVHHYYVNFEVLHSWSKLPFYRRWRRSREIRIESAMAGMKNAILSSHSRLPPIKPVAATGPAIERPIYQEQDVPKVVAWGSGNFGNRKGSPPMPNKGCLSTWLDFVMLSRCQNLELVSPAPATIAPLNTMSQGMLSFVVTSSARSIQIGWMGSIGQNAQNGVAKGKRFEF